MIRHTKGGGWHRLHILWGGDHRQGWTDMQQYRGLVRRRALRIGPITFVHLRLVDADQVPHFAASDPVVDGERTAQRGES